MIRDVFLAHFLERIDKKELIKASILAGIDTAEQTTANLRENLYYIMRHTRLPHKEAKKHAVKIGRVTFEVERT